MKLYYIILIFLIVGCKHDKITSPPTETLTVEIPEDFVVFYNEFHSDSIFQINHIIFPLASGGNDIKWQKDEWKLHKAFNSKDGSYSRDFDNFGGIITETIKENSGAYIIERRFSKFENSYQLIYYSTKSQLQGWTPE